MKRRNSLIRNILAGRAMLVLAAGVAVAAAVAVGLRWLSRASNGNTAAIDASDSIDVTPMRIEALKGIRQWEFLTVSDEELVDTVRRGIFTDDHLARIYYGTMRLGIDMADTTSNWLSRRGDTIVVALPPIRLLDDDFIDEARTRPFIEDGRWSHADRALLYDKARAVMTRRGLSPSNVRSAELNATTQFDNIMRAMGFSNVRVSIGRQKNTNKK